MFNNGVRHMNSMPFSTAARRDSRAWSVQVWISFGIAAFLSATGLYWLPGSLIERAFMVMAYVFSLSSVFVLSRHVRDQAEGLPQTPRWGLVVWVGFWRGFAAHRLGLVADADQPRLQGLFDGVLAVHGGAGLHLGQDAA